MSEIVKNKYLDFEGLKKYDELLKAFIESGHKGLADAIAALDAKLGSLEFEGSDDKSFAEVINEIYSAIADIVEKQGALDEKDVELEGKIKDIIGDLESLEGLTLAEISAKLSQHTTDIADVTDRVTALEETVKNLGEIEGGESLGDIVNKVNSNIVAIETLKGDGEGSVKKAAADALAAAKEYADDLNADMDERVAALEEIDHEQLVADAIAAVVAGADSEFDTLKEVADWILSDTTGAAALQTTVSGHTESINAINGDIDALEAKVDDDIANLTNHISDAATALAEVDGRLDALEAFEETHASIEVTDIEGLFA
jgi:polyhydroxyalkanoate synthesis regulator phasin